jgi:hypothetical protein
MFQPFRSKPEGYLPLRTARPGPAAIRVDDVQRCIPAKRGSCVALQPDPDTDTAAGPCRECRCREVRRLSRCAIQNKAGGVDQPIAHEEPAAAGITGLGCA